MERDNYHYSNTDIKDIDCEEWIDVIGFDGIYEVSNFGRVKSVGRMIQFETTRCSIERWVSERILRQAIGKSSLIATLCINGICKRFIVARLMFFSFNYNIKNLPEYFVIHKNNDWKDNQMNNLKIGTTSERSALTFKAGKMEHLKDGNPMLSKHNRGTAHVQNGEIISKICVKCGERKNHKEFRDGHNKCKPCVWEELRIKLGTKKRRCNGIKTTCQLTGKVNYYNNYNDPKLLKRISIGCAMKHVENKTICKPYFKKDTFVPFKIEKIEL